VRGPTRVPVGVFFALFTISGFAGLIYESIWSHYLKLFLGHAAYAQTLVLAIFMGGMAIGSWLVSRFTHRIRNLLAGYAFAELGIGFLAIAFHRVFVGVTGWAYDSVMPALAGTGVDLFKWSLASLLILPASILLGTTFPLMSAGVMRLYPGSGGRSLSMLYFTNSFGAALGVLASGFFLIDNLGLPGTILTAGLLNAVLALTVWMITKRLPEVAPEPAAASPAAAGGTIVRTVLALALATGAASFIYEITWIRMLTLGLGASTHSFEVMLAAFILAMSLGAFWFRNRIANLRNDLAWLAGLIIAKALLAIWAIWIYDDVLAFLGWMMQSVTRSEGGYVLVTGGGMLASMVVMFPTAFCAGMTLPLATHVLTSRGFGESSIGKVYAANTAGCILGAAFATHVGMELAGIKGLTGIGALLDLAVGIFLIAVTSDAAGRKRSYGMAAAVAAIGLAAYFGTHFDTLRMSSGVYRYGIFANPETSKVQFYRDGKTATIAVMDTGSIRAISTNGKPDASIETDPARRYAIDEPTMVLVAALALATRPGAAEVANIGFGSGLTTHTLLGSPRIQSLDTIEIERAMIEGARWFMPRNRRAYEDPRSRLHIEDAKTFFATQGKRYDLIVSEPSNPWVSGVSTLFSDEFYAHVRRYIKDDGVLLQWMQAYEINMGLLSSIFEALGKNFEDYAVYRTGADLIVVARPKGKLPPLSQEVFDLPGTAAELRYLGYNTLQDLQALRVGGKAALAPLFVSSGFPLNSDYFPIVDQRAPRARFMKETAEELPNLREDLVPVLAVLDGESRIAVDRLASGGLNRPIVFDRALVGTEAIGVFLTGAADRSRALNMDQRATSILAHGLLADCTGSQREWLEALTQIAREATPYVARDDVAVLFDRAKASRCYASLDEAGRERFAWLQAINDRNAAGMLQHAQYLLGHAPGSEADAGRYLQSAILGAIASGRIAEARALRDRYVKQLPKPERQKLGLELLLAHLAQMPGEPAR